MSGWGGAGAFSDGKLTLTTEFGGWLHDYMTKEKLTQLIAYVDNIYVENGAPAVSYTHLDVYKRQTLATNRKQSHQNGSILAFCEG